MLCDLWPFSMSGLRDAEGADGRLTWATTLRLLPVPLMSSQTIWMMLLLGVDSHRLEREKPFEVLILLGRRQPLPALEQQQDDRLVAVLFDLLARRRRLAHRLGVGVLEPVVERLRRGDGEEDEGDGEGEEGDEAGHCRTSV